MPKVSFILPAYKRPFLYEAIASILGQTYTDFELVVVDDCSPENLKEVVEQFQDVRLSYHQNEINLGQENLVAAWTHAMEYATGKWCILASDDDVYLPQCLEKLMTLQAKYPQCDLFHARNADIDAMGNWTRVAFPRPEFESQIELTYARAALRLEQRMPDFMFRRNALNAIGGFVNFPLAWYSDDATWIKLSRNGCAHTRDVMFCFRNSGINLSSGHDEKTCKAKIEAGFQFEHFVNQLMTELKPQTGEERLLLKEMLPRIKKQIFLLQKCEIDATKTFAEWRAMLQLFPFSPCAKRELFYSRYPRIRALRLILPHLN